MPRHHSQPACYRENTKSSTCFFGSEVTCRRLRPTGLNSHAADRDCRHNELQYGERNACGVGVLKSTSQWTAEGDTFSICGAMYPPPGAPINSCNHVEVVETGRTESRTSSQPYPPVDSGIVVGQPYFVQQSDGGQV